MELLNNSDKVIDTWQKGNTICYMLKGSAKNVGARMVTLKEDTEVNLEYAIAIAFKIKKMDEFLKWLEETKNWKDGGYFVPMDRKRN